MKLKTILLSLCLLLSTSVFADNNENCYTSADVEQRDGLYYLTGQDNPFTGTSKCVYSDTGQIKSLGEIKNGKFDGKLTVWYENGQKKMEAYYKDGKANGEYTLWHENGQKKMEAYYKDGKLDVKWTDWNEDGTVEKVEYYENGESINFIGSVLADNNENCYISSDVERRYGLYYLAGQDNPFTGTSKCVNSDTGQIKSLGEIRDGKLDGKWTEWHTNGQKFVEKNYKDGKLEGALTLWGGLIDGQKEYEENYKDGKLEGKRTVWNGSGQKSKEENYKDVKLVLWDENGKLKSEEIYKDGKLDVKKSMRPWDFAWFVPFTLLTLFGLVYAIRRVRGRHTISQKTSEVSQVTDDNELGVPVKTPEHDEKSTIKGINVFLAGIAVGAISVFFGVVVLIVSESPLLTPLSALVSVPLVAVFWRSLSTESTKPRGGNFIYLVLISICASLMSVLVLVVGVIGVVVIGAIVGAILSVPYAAYVGYINKKIANANG